MASVVLGTSRVLGAVLKGANRPLDATIAEGAGLIVTLAGLAILLPLFRSVGAAITSLLAFTTSAVLALSRANRALEARGIELLLPSSLPTPRQLDPEALTHNRR